VINKDGEFKLGEEMRKDGIFKMLRALDMEKNMFTNTSKYCGSSPCDHSLEKPALVTTNIICKTVLEASLKRCN